MTNKQKIAQQEGTRMARSRWVRVIGVIVIIVIVIVVILMLLGPTIGNMYPQPIVSI